jgi:MFS family permease
MLSGKPHLLRNIKLLYALNFFANSSFILPIYILFGKDFLGLSYLQAGSFLLVSWFTSIAFDFLGGLVADKAGRKQAYLLGIAIQILTLVPFLITKSYGVLLISSVISGIGVALSSNSVDALVYEEVAAYGDKKIYQHASATAQIFVFTGRVFASVLGGFAYSIHPLLPYVLYGIALIAAFIACYFIRIGKAIEAPKSMNYLEMVKTSLSFYKGNLTLIKFVAIGGLFFLWADLLFSHYQPIYIELGVSSFTLGILFSLLSVFSALGAYLMRKFPDTRSPHAIQSLSILGILATGVLFVILKLPLILAAPIPMALISGFINPNMRLYINNHAPDNVRASVLSLASTILNIGSGIGFLLSFYIADHFNKTTALIIVLIGAGLTLLVNNFLHVKERPIESATISI